MQPPPSSGNGSVWHRNSSFGRRLEGTGWNLAPVHRRSESGAESPPSVDSGARSKVLREIRGPDDSPCIALVGPSSRPRFMSRGTGSDPILALIGCGAIAEALHLPALARRHASVASRMVLVDRDTRRAETLARRFGAGSVCADYREI